jgi:hypothetical protein
MLFEGLAGYPPFPGAAQHLLMMRCRPGSFQAPNLERSRLCGATLRKSNVLHRIREKD